MKKIALLSLICVTILIIFTVQRKSPADLSKPEKTRWLEIQSIDTMKYSRDLAREKLGDPSFNVEIDDQVKAIAATGATHIAIGTPYDAQFLPFLKRWVKSARKNNLHVWFRGNMSGWEEWFEYPPMTREEHTKAIDAFIRSNPDLFEDGDIFSSCPECENGGPGDPRQTGDIKGHRAFLIQEYKTSSEAFESINKKVSANFNSMNFDVASAIMDPETTKALGGIIVVDHYVTDPVQTVTDLDNLATLSLGKIVLGEVGAPIPDLHGDFSEEDQDAWIRKMMSALVMEPNIIGINYWTSHGSSTQIWHSDGEATPAVASLTHFFMPHYIYGKVIDQNNIPVSNAEITIGSFKTTSNRNGTFTLLYTNSSDTLLITKESYAPQTIQVKNKASYTITLYNSKPSSFQKNTALIRNLFVK